MTMETTTRDSKRYNKHTNLTTTACQLMRSLSLRLIINTTYGNQYIYIDSLCIQHTTSASSGAARLQTTKTVESTQLSRTNLTLFT